MESRQAVLLRFMTQLRDSYAEMDNRYHAVADRYGFICSGCEDNCCKTRFYHHTLLEYFYLQKGVDTLAADQKQDIGNRARTIVGIETIADRKGLIVRHMCPLNIDQRCILYPYRPMICRLHGIPHELHRPDRNIHYQPGCHAFYQQCSTAPYQCFDRTPLYQRMAELERALKATLHFSRKIKMTISEMLVADPLAESVSDLTAY